jgi:hypothetical protein
MTTGDRDDYNREHAAHASEVGRDTGSIEVVPR